MKEDFQKRVREMQERNLRKKQLILEKLEHTPFEQRTSEFVLDLIHNDGDTAEHVWDAIADNQFPSAALDFKVAMAILKSDSDNLGRMINKFSPNDHQKIIEHCITHLPRQSRNFFIKDVLKNTAGSTTLDRRILTEKLLQSDIHRGYILSNLKQLDLNAREIETVIDQSLNGGYIESAIRAIDTIPDLDEEAFIHKLLTHEEKLLNARKIVDHLHKFHISKDRLEDVFRSHLAEDKVSYLLESIDKKSIDQGQS